MDSHIRVFIGANWDALGCLPPIAYKVLLCLVARADGLGRCFPSAERIADDCGCNIDSVWPALQALEDRRYIAYLRRNEYDPVTGRKVPNVYLVSPYFMVVAAEYEDDALRLWGSIYMKNPLPLSEISANNQQQEPAPLTNTIESESRTNNNNQRTSERGDAGAAPENGKESAGYAKKAKKQKSKSQDKSEKPESDESQQAEGQQRSKKHGRSAPSYANPDAVAAPLPDELLEHLANRIQRLGVPIPLARGFVIGYGGEMCEAALLQVAAAKSTGQKIDNEAGLFRHLLQNRLIDSSLPDILERKQYGGYDSSGWNLYSE